MKKKAKTISNKEADQKRLSKKIETALSDDLKEIKEDMENLSKMKPTDFKKGVVKEIKDTEEAVLDLYSTLCCVIDQTKKDFDVLINYLSRQFKTVDELFNIVADRLEQLELLHTQGPPHNDV